MAEIDSNSNLFQDNTLIHKRHHFSQIDSTNTWAKKNNSEWASKGLTLVTASEQTNGRGRLDRIWISPPDVNLYATYCFWRDLNQTNNGHLPQLLSLALCEVLQSYHLQAQIKWPNDVMIDQKKIAGILCETFTEKNRQGIVCGVGVNINISEQQLITLNRPCTSMLIETKKEYSLIEFQEKLNRVFSFHLHHFLQHGFAKFFPLYQKALCVTQGQMLSFHHHKTHVQAQFEKVCEDGSLVLKLHNGQYQQFYAGEFVTLENLTNQE